MKIRLCQKTKPILHDAGLSLVSFCIKLKSYSEFIFDDTEGRAKTCIRYWHLNLSAILQRFKYLMGSVSIVKRNTNDHHISLFGRLARECI